MFHAQNCILLSFQSFLCARQRCVNEVLVIQGLLGKIQEFFKDLSKCLNFQGIFKGLMLFQGLFKARANHECSQTNTGIPKVTPELVMPVHLFKHLAHNFYICNCFKFS